MNKTLIVTGASGFVGQNLYAYLNENFIFQPLSIRYTPKQHLILNSNFVIHLAGKAHDLKSVSQPKDYYEANFKLTKQLYAAFLKSNAQKFIYISSVKAAADHINEPLTEMHPPSPLTHYGKSKLLAEEYISSQPLPQGKSFYILRPCMIHGPGNKGNLNLLHKFASRGIPYPLAAFDNKRSFLSVENLCFVIKELLDSDNIPSGLYNVADDEPLSTTQLYSLISASIDKIPSLLNITPSIIFCIAKIGDKLGLPLNSERLGKLTENYVVSNTKIKHAIKKELPLGAQQGIILTAQSFK